MEKKFEFSFDFLEVHSIIYALESKKRMYEDFYDDIDEFPATASDYHRICDLITKLRKIYD